MAHFYFLRRRINIRHLVCRIAAYGDVLITTPLIRHLKECGDEIYYLSSEQAEQILNNNPKVDKIIPHKKDSVSSDMLGDYFKATAQAYECDNVIDLCESIEVSLSLHPARPAYKYPKNEKARLFNRNFYEFTFEKAGVDWTGADLKPEFYPTDDELSIVNQIRRDNINKFIVIWGLSGSSRNKVYPYSDHVISEFLSKHDDVMFITVGDESCQILEFNVKNYPNVITMSGVWTMRQSIAACQMADLVVSPDTGLLHGAGCFDTPKIGLLNATTKEQITKHFKNDYSLEADGVGCSPCFSLIYDADTQCSTRDHRAPVCMASGIPKERLLAQMEAVYARHKEEANALSLV